MSRETVWNWRQSVGKGQLCNEFSRRMSLFRS